MLSRVLSRFCPSTPARATQPARRPLALEALEAREVPATLYALLDNNRLLRFDSATPGTTATLQVTGLQGTDVLQGIDFRPRTGQLIGTAVASGTAAGTVDARTYRIHLGTGAATLIGTAAGLNNTGDIDTGYEFNPTVDRIRYVTEAGGNLRLNPNTGALVQNDTPLSASGVMAPAPQVIGAAYDRNFDRPNAARTPTTMFVINRADSTLSRQGGIDGNPSFNGGVITPVGALGFTLNPGSEGGFDIQHSLDATRNNGGLGIAFAALTPQGATRPSLYTINLSTGAATLVGQIGTTDAEVFELAAVPEGALVIGSGAGTAAAAVGVLSAASGNSVVSQITPFAGFGGAVRVAAGDVTGDGIPDAVVAAVGVPNAHVKVFNGATGAEVQSFFAFQGFLGAVSVGSGDVNGDGVSDVLVAASVNGHVKAFSGADGSELASFFAFQGFTGAVSIASGDFDNNGTDEIVVAAASNGHVRVFGGTSGISAAFTSATLPNFTNSFFSYANYFGAVSVAVGDVTGDGVADFVTSSGAGVVLDVRVFGGTTAGLLNVFSPTSFGTGFAGGATAAVVDFNQDGRYDVALAPGAGTEARVFAFDPTGTTLGSFAAFSGFSGGVSAGGVRF